jgi:hypothetical protein
MVSPKIGDLAVGVAALADDHGTGMHAGAEVRHDGELGLVWAAMRSWMAKKQSRELLCGLPPLRVARRRH